MSEPGRLTTGTDPGVGSTYDEAAVSSGGESGDELIGPDRGFEHLMLYGVIFLVISGGAVLLGSPSSVAGITTPSTHTLMESLSTLLGFLVGTLALVRYYSRKQITFLLIGCGFLGGAILDLNHLVGTIPQVLAYRGLVNDQLMYAWTWTAGRVYLSLFLFMSLVAWRQEVKTGQAEGFSEAAVYGTALLLTVVNLLFFDYTRPAVLMRPGWFAARPAEFVPALFFALAFVGFYRKNSWRRDQFEHWLMVSLLIGALLHGAFMAFSAGPLDVMSDGAHLLKIASLLAVLTGLLHSVYSTFTREGAVLRALQDSNDALAREVEVRARTEEAVNESSGRLQRFLDDANDLIQTVDQDGRFLYVNRSWKRVLGYTDDDLERMSLFDIVQPAHRSALRSEFDRLNRGGTPRRFNTEYLASDGRGVLLSASSQVQFSGDQAVSTQTILRDVTEQRMAETRLGEAQRNLEAIVENTGDLIWSVDRDHRLITMNSAFALAVEARTGSEPRVSQLPNELFKQDDAQWYRELYAKTLAGSRHVDVRTDRVDGELRFFEMYANPIQSVEGVVGAVFFAKDVTNRVRAEEALHVAKEEAEAANKAKSDFLANMSHELRTPLNSVIGFTNILLKNKDDRLEEKELGFLSRVLSNGKHLLALINEVLDLAKVEAGRMELVIEEVNLADFCVETVQQLEGQAKAKEGRVELVAEVPESVRPVETDAAKLKQVIINLVGNAVKFTEEGSVTVRLDLADDGETPTAIAVVDTGIGIPKDRLEAIFEAFQQAEAGTSRKFGGTGLGLALSRSICLLMGYDLIVESELGRGSTFKVVMGERAIRPVLSAEAPGVDGQEPASEAALAVGSLRHSAALAPVGAATDGYGPRSEESSDGTDDSLDSVVTRSGWEDFKVLIVDDEPDSRLLMEHLLADFGCQVFTASNGVEGLEVARRVQPDLIMLDLIMPEMTGWEVLKQAKADSDLRAIPIVVASVLANEGRGKLLGAVDAVTKPFDREDFLRVLWRNLGRRRGGRVLLMVHDEGLGQELAEVVRGRGLDAKVVREGQVLSLIEKETPDAVVLDLGAPGIRGGATLLAIRDSRLHTGLPVLAVTTPALSDHDREMVRELSTVFAPRDGASDALAKLLEASFHVTTSD